MFTSKIQSPISGLVYLRDNQGCYLHFVNKLGGYFSHSLKHEGALTFSNTILAYVFAKGYNSGCKDSSDFVSPSVEDF